MTEVNRKDDLEAVAASAIATHARECRFEREKEHQAMQLPTPWLAQLFGWRKILVSIFSLLVILGLSFQALRYAMIEAEHWVDIVYYVVLLVIAALGANVAKAFGQKRQEVGNGK